MSNAPAILRWLIIYAVCVPLAIAVGFLLTNPMDYSTLGLLGILALLLVSPLLLRWHHPLLFLSWNTSVSVFFIKSAPSLWLVMVALSLGISLLERALNSQMRFIPAPWITWPLLCLIGVVLFTAEVTGGIGVRAFGSEVYGGKKYIILLAGIFSYFALTSRRIPPERAGLYVALFFLGGVTDLIRDLYPLAPSWAGFIFWFVPPNFLSYESVEVGVTRLHGFAGAGFMLWCLLIARYGIRGIFLSGKLWRPVAFLLCFSAIFLGGFRNELITAGAIFALQFFLEGLHRTKILLPFALLGVLAVMAIIPLSSKLPYTFQRTLAFLPLNLDPAVKEDAQGSVDWRVNMWKALLPQVPKYLLLGKGMAISPEEYNEMMGGKPAFSVVDASQQSLALSYDYHNGPLSVIIPFGIWGCIVVIWFFAAGLHALHCNFKYGDPLLRTINTLFFVLFLVQVCSFMVLGGGLSSDLPRFVGILGFSVALNGGVCRPASQPVPAREAFQRPRGVLPRSQPRPAFPR